MWARWCCGSRWASPSTPSPSRWAERWWGRQEDAQYGSLPIVMVLLVSYAVATAVSANDLGGLAVVRVASYIPPLTPMLMPVRAALGELAWWEVPTAAAVMVLVTYGLLQSGQSVKLRDAWKLARG